MKIFTTKAGWCLRINLMRQSFRSVRFLLIIQNMLMHELIVIYYFEGAFGHPDFVDQAMGLTTPYSHIPHHLLSYSDDMSYSERAYNLILSLYDWWFRTHTILPNQNVIAQRYFSHLISKFNSQFFLWMDWQKYNSLVSQRRKENPYR